MRSKVLLAVLAPLAIALVACNRETTSERVREDKKDISSPYVPGQALVKLSEGEAATGLFSDLGVTSIKKLLPDAGRFEKRTREAGLDRWYVIEYTADIPASKAAESYSSLPGIEYFEPVTRARACGFFNDPGLELQWHYYSDGSIAKEGSDVDVVPVWSDFTTGDPNVIVCVVDGGIDYQHEDLQGQVLLSNSFNFISNNTAIIPHRHGTHVAGTIAAINNNGKGVCGLAGGNAAAGNSGVKLISCQVFEHNTEDPEHDRSASSYQFASAIKWGADHGAVICNNSWGTVYKTENEAREAETSAYFKECVDYFNTYAGFDEFGNQVGPMAGGLVVFAAGNESWRYAHPCDYEGVLAVGAIDAEGKRANYSNYGDWVDICAPGGSYLNRQVLSTIPGDSYASFEGTSMACPHVSGVAALVVSYCGGMGFTREMLLNRLLGGVKSGYIASYNQIGELVSAYGAIAYGENYAPQPVASTDIDILSNTVTVSWKVGQSDEGVKAYGYKLIVSEDESLLSGINPASPPAGTSSRTVLAGDKQVGDDISIVLSDLEFSHHYYSVVAGYDISGNYSDPSPIMSITTGVNHPPVINLDLSFRELHAFEVLKVPFTITEEDNHAFTFELQDGGEVVYIATNPLTGKEIVIDATKATAGSYTATLRAVDSYGASSEKAISFKVLENALPVVIKAPDRIVIHGKGTKTTMDLAEFISDPDGEPLTYSASISKSGLLHPVVSGSTLTLTSLSLGGASVTISGKDARGEVATTSFDVLVRNPSVDIQTYPNPCKDDLYVAAGEEDTDVFVEIRNSNGAVVYSKTVGGVSVFNPLHIDLSGVAPGRYSLKVAYNGKLYENTLIKR